MSGPGSWELTKVGQCIDLRVGMVQNDKVSGTHRAALIF